MFSKFTVLLHFMLQRELMNKYTTHNTATTFDKTHDHTQSYDDKTIQVSIRFLKYHLIYVVRI